MSEASKIIVTRSPRYIKHTYLPISTWFYSYFENSATANYMSGNLSKAPDQINVVINDLNPLNGVILKTCGYKASGLKVLSLG